MELLGWKMFVLGALAANQIWIVLMFIFVTPKIQRLRELEGKK